jgi:hypothetical protein
MSTDKMRAAVDSICSKNPHFCQAVQGNSTAGVYGAFLGCSLAEVSSWIFTKVVEEHNDSALCKSLAGTTQTPTSSPSQDSDCRILLDQAGPDGMGVVTYKPETKSTVNNSGIKSGSKISTQAAVATGVGIFIGLILISILILAIRARRRRKGGAKNNDLQEFGKAELEDNSNTIQTKGLTNTDALGWSELLAEGDGSQRRELGADGPVEIDTDAKRFEIGGEGAMHEIGTEGEMYELPSGNERLELPAGNDKAELATGDDKVELPTGVDKAELPGVADKAEAPVQDEKAELSKRDNLGL